MENIETLLKDIKNNFYRFRNGIIANSMRVLYPKGKMIFGLNVPQFIELSSLYPKSRDLAKALWDDNSSRETRLLALYLFPPSSITFPDIIELMESLESTEQADFLAFKVLRNIPDPKEVYNELIKIKFTNPLSNYAINMFQKNIEARYN